jgi:NNP family nitrate/nitrite transporter-like MFS transporter
MNRAAPMGGWNCLRTGSQRAGHSPACLMMVLGVAVACGMASTFKCISDDFPENMGAVSGIVGMAGGLGGFLLPIMFGAILDRLG